MKTPTEIISDIENEFGLSPGSLQGRSRSSHVYEARKNAYRELYQYGYSSVEIGKILNRHHTSVLYGLGTVTRGNHNLRPVCSVCGGALEINHDNYVIGHTPVCSRAAK